MQWKVIIECLRPKQWIKNLFIFLPLFFGGMLLNVQALTQTLLAFVGFCFLSSSVYIINDIADIQEDKIHPKKKYRPIASNSISVKNAILLAAGVFITSVLILFALTNCTGAVMWSSAYLLLNILYTFVLKKYSIIDAVVIACGFVIRVYLGASAGELNTSGWIVVLVFIIALLLAFGKRRDDLNNLEKTNTVSRKNVFTYSIEFLNVILSVLSAVIAVTYIQYTLSPEVTERIGENLFITVPFVIMGLLRYLQIVLVEKKEFNPTDILWKDTFLQLTIAAWVLTFIFFLYF